MMWANHDAFEEFLKKNYVINDYLALHSISSSPFRLDKLVSVHRAKMGFLSLLEFKIKANQINIIEQTNSYNQQCTINRLHNREPGRS